MKITEVSYRSLRTGRGYNNTAVEAKAHVGDGEDPAKVLAELRFWTDKAVDDTLERENAYEKLCDIKASVAYAQEELERLQKRAQAYRNLLKEKTRLAELARNHGLGGDALLLDQI